MSKLSIKAIAIATVAGGAVLGATFASAALVLPTQNCSYSFDRNFRMGSTGTDVQNLQKVLNAYPQTRVSETGAGSPGMESTYYGAKTKTAVVKFQNLHAADILTPNGLTVGNGNVYSSTRSVLNQICSSVAKPTTPATPTTPTTPVTTGPVSVSLSASQPQQMLVIGQSGAKLADFTFTGNGTVTNVQLQRVGIATDSTLTNVYLYDGNTRITDASSVVTGGYINFNSPTGLFTVNGSRTISVRADIASAPTAVAGNSVGVKLNSVTTLGGSAATFTNVQGNQLVLATVSNLATVAFSTISTSTLKVDAGTTNYNVWSGSATVSNRATNLKAATFKFVGSAPVDSVANLSLYVDGAKVAGPTTINAMNNNKVSFDLGANPLVLTTGSHTFDLRGDIVKGSARSMTFSIENVADLMLEDSSLPGVNVSAMFNGVAFTQGNATYGQITVNSGSVTTNVDSSFVANKVTGGSTGATVGQFTMKAYGEDVKVSTLTVTFATISIIPTLNNVALYVNGGQVGTSQNFTGTALTYTLGSSLIIPANTTVTVAVKADIVDANSAAYSAGTIAAKITGGASVGQGQSSYETVSVASTPVTGNTLTVSSGAGTFAKTAGFTSTTVSPNTSNVKIGSFTIQANSAESIKVTSAGVNPVVTGSSTTGLPNTISNYSNLTLKTGSTILGTPVGNPASGTTTFSFNEIVIPANGTQTFDVYADVGSNATTTIGIIPAVTVAMSVTYRGSISNTTTVSSANSVAISSAAATFANPTLVSSSPVGQYVVGGQTFGIATFKLATAMAGTQANVRELRFTTTGADAITSITVGGVTAPVISAGTTTVSGLNINIDSNGTPVPVTVAFSGFQGSTKGGSLSASVSPVSITLGYVEGTSGSGSVITNVTPVSSNNMKLVASKPTVTVSSGLTNTLVLSTVAETKVGEFTVTADPNGKIAIASTSLSLSTSGIVASTTSITGGRVADGNTSIAGASVAGTSTMVITFSPAYEIGAGQSKTFSVYAKISGTDAGGVTPYVTSILTSGDTFNWIDVLGGNSAQTGASIYNFPTNNYATSH